MLTHNKTPFLIANIIENNKIIDKIYYDDTKNKMKEVKLNQCPYCLRQFGRNDLFKKHLVVCRTKLEYLLRLHEENPSHFRNFSIDRNNDAKLQLAFPLATGERLVMLISGMNGCGKSYFIAQLLDNYLDVYKDRDIFLFSTQEFDDKLDVFRKITRVILDDSFLETELKLSDLRNSLCIFDDVDGIRNKKLYKAVDALKFDILKNGRDHAGDRKDDIDIIVSNHTVLGGHETKIMIHESFFYVLFPQGTTAHSIDTICRKYVGLNKEQTQKVLKSDSRAVVIHKNYPRYVMTDKEIFLI